jgi:serine/threonine-protein kinase RsbW
MDRDRSPPDVTRKEQTDTMNTADFKLSFPGEPMAVRLALGEVTSWIRSAGIDEEFCGSVELVLAEALNNIAEHAYGEGAPGPVDLELQHRPPELKLTLMDTGRAMPGGQLPEGRAVNPDPTLDDLPEGGFGWHIIRTLTRELTYCRDGGLNRLSFLMGLDCHGDGPASKQP